MDDIELNQLVGVAVTALVAGQIAQAYLNRSDDRNGMESVAERAVMLARMILTKSGW